MNDFLVRFAWFGLGNLAIAIPMAAVAWWSGRFGRPALTHALWVLVLLKLATPPLGHVPFDFGPTAEPAPIVAAPVLPADALPIVELPEIFRRPIRSAPALPVEVAAPIDWIRLLVTTACGIWLAGSVVVLGWALVRLVRFGRLLRLATPASDAIVVEATRLAEALGVSCPRILLLPGAISPLLWVGWRAYLIVPADLLDRLDGQQRAALLLHELAHWRRGDHWVRRLETVVLALYWWCPLAWWAKSQLQQAEEECCDAWVVATAPESVRAYALALVETVDFLSGDSPALPPLASGLGPFTSLRRRLTMIFRNPMPRMLTAPGLCGLGLVAALCLSWSPMPASVLAQDSPRQGRKPAPPPEADPQDNPRGGREAPKAKERDLQSEVERLEREIAATLRELKEVQEKEKGRANEGRGEQRGEQRGPQDTRPNPEPRGKEGKEKERRAQADEKREEKRDEKRDEKKEERKIVIDPKGGGVFRLELGGNMAGRADLERRMSEVERKLDTILWTLTEMRRAGGGQPGRVDPVPPTPPAPPMPPGGRGPRSAIDPAQPNANVDRRPIGRPRGGEEALPPPVRDRQEQR